MAARYRVEFADDGLVVSTWGTLVLAEFSQALKTERLDALRRVLEHESRVHRTFLMCMVFELSNFDVRKMGAPGMREGAGELFKSFSGNTSAFAMVFEGGGLAASTIRSTLTVLSLIVPSERRPRFFSSRADAFAWLRAQNAALLPCTLDEFSAKIDSLRGERTAPR